MRLRVHRRAEILRQRRLSFSKSSCWRDEAFHKKKKIEMQASIVRRARTDAVRASIKRKLFLCLFFIVPP
jgi:hypothetical protein